MKVMDFCFKLKSILKGLCVIFSDFYEVDNVNVLYMFFI